jgi:ankyrin repeat protein
MNRWVIMMLCTFCSYIWAGDLFFSAVKDGRNELVNKLIKSRVIDINAVDERDYTPLMHASLYGYINIVKTLLNHLNIDAAYINRKNESALNLASYAEHVEVMEELVG